MKRSLLLMAVLALVAVGSALAQNSPPPPGAILDLNGLPIPAGFQQYDVLFKATLSNTAITFAFRDDLGALSFEDASLVDATTASANLLTNGDFHSGSTGWTAANLSGSGSPGVAVGGCGGPDSAGDCWADGISFGYDAISQTLATTPGDEYLVSFYVAENSGQTTFSSVTTSDLAGIDVVTYAAGGTSVPEPASLVLLLAGAAVVGLRRRLFS
jgi:hypothetical protein